MLFIKTLYAFQCVCKLVRNLLACHSDTDISLLYISQAVTDRLLSILHNPGDRFLVIVNAEGKMMLLQFVVIEYTQVYTMVAYTYLLTSEM